MKTIAMLAFLCGLQLTAAGALGSVVDKGHPIGKVIHMLEGLKAKSIFEGKQEAVAYDKFAYWCSSSIDRLKDAIKDEKETIAELNDQLAGLEERKATLEEEISGLKEQIKDMQASGAQAKEDRKKEAALYAQTSQDLKDTIKAVDDCITELEAAQSKTEPGKMLLAQRHVRKVLALIGFGLTDEHRKNFESFVHSGDGDKKDRPDQLAKGDLEKHVDKYDFKSEDVIELLKQLKIKFEDENLAAVKAETNAVNAYDLAKEARDNAIAAATKAKNKKRKELAKVKLSIVETTKSLKDTESDLRADSKTLEDTEDACATKKSEWETRSKTRSLEIEAMDQAMKILSKTTGVRTEAPGNPVPPPSPVFFLQFSQAPSDPKMKAVVLLRTVAKDLKSRSLERLAVEVQAHLRGPFDQVNNMIEQMIFRLMDEQKQEDEHKMWCDKEIMKTKTMIVDKTDRIKDLNAEIKLQKSTVQKLTEEIASAQQMVSDVNEFMKEATEIREVGKKENSLAIKDAMDAQQALTNAIAVLEAFYKESGEIPKEPWEFLQAPVKLPKNPATWDSSYTAVADPTRPEFGIITVLEDVLSDFEKMESETKSQEAVDQKAYEETMKTNKIEKAERTQEANMKEAEKARRSEKIVSLESQKKSTNTELQKTVDYLRDLNPACVDGNSSYTDRKAARAKEIKALKEAQVILTNAFEEKGGKPAKFLQISRHHKLS